MATSHETFFFLTVGTGPRPTYAEFLAAAAQRTAKTKDNRRECEKKKEQKTERQIQRDKAWNEAGGVGVMRLLGLRRVREKGALKGRNDKGKHIDTEGGPSVDKEECKNSAKNSVDDVPKSK